MTPSRRIALPLRTLTAALALGLAGTAAAGVSYRLDRPSAAPGDTVTIEAVYFNEGNARATWELSLIHIFGTMTGDTSNVCYQVTFQRRPNNSNNCRVGDP